MKYIATYFFCFVIFCAWRFYKQRKSERLEKKTSDAFWEREAKANHTRKKDISHLPLLNVQEAEIPITNSNDEVILYYIDQLRQIIKTPMIDLSEYSNTDLKLAYGVANFKTLSEYDENYNTFLVTLSNLGRSYAQANLNETAKSCYEMALSYGSKQLSDYTELANIYLKLDTPERINDLIAQLEDGVHPRKSTIIATLQQIMMEYQ